MKRVLIALSVALVFLFKAGSGVVMAEDVVVADGKTISFDYTLTVDGKVVESSKG